MGINFEKTRKYKLGDIIYPAYNGTNGWLQKPRWDLVTGVDKKSNIITARSIHDYATIAALQILVEFYGLKFNKKKNLNGIIYRGKK